jgi:hypothetical protein
MVRCVLRLEANIHKNGNMQQADARSNTAWDDTPDAISLKVYFIIFIA